MIRRRSVVVAFLVILASSILACGSQQAPPAAQTGITHAPDPLSPVVASAPLSKVARNSPFSYAIRLAKNELRLGDTLRMRLVVVNHSSVVAEFTLTSSPSEGFDFFASSDNSRPVWSHRGGRDLDLNVYRMYVSPGDSIVFASQWDLRDVRRMAVPPGRYWIRAEFPSKMSAPWILPIPVMVRGS
ncbi:MAG: BsuPI-related putative proteinase inhibitor [Gemmatimonadaceae bacterium]